MVLAQRVRATINGINRPTAHHGRIRVLVCYADTGTDCAVSTLGAGWVLRTRWGQRRILASCRLATTGKLCFRVKGAREPWSVITDETPTLQTLWQYGLRFRIEELFLDSKSGAFELDESRIRSAKALERLYLVVA